MIYGFNAGEVFKISIEIEENGRQFYEKAQAKTQDPEVKAIFRELGQEEVKHKARFKELMDELPESTTASTVWDPEGELDQYLKMMADMHVFRSSADVDAQLAKVANSQEALDLAIRFEKDSIIFFLEMQDRSENEEGRKKIGLLVAEEQSHLRRLSLELVKLKKK